MTPAVMSLLRDPLRWSQAAGALLLSLGFVIAFAPRPVTAQLFGMPDLEPKLHLVLAVREGYLGVVLLLLAALREARALGWVLITICVVPAIDFVLVMRDPSGTFLSASRHLVGIPVMAALGAALLRRAAGRR